MQHTLRTIGALAVAIALCGASGCSVGTIIMQDAQPTVQGSGKRASETRTVPAFRRIDLAGSGKLTVTAGAPQKVQVEIDDNLLPLVTTKVENGTLRIGTKGGYRSERGLRVTVMAPVVEGVAITGSGSAAITGVSGPRFAAAVSGSGSIEASGSADAATATIDGSGSVQLQNLRARSATVQIAGSGRIEVNATDSVAASIAGSGDIAYAGNPKTVTKSVAGSGRIRSLGR